MFNKIFLLSFVASSISTVPRMSDSDFEQLISKPGVKKHTSYRNRDVRERFPAGVKVS